MKFHNYVWLSFFIVQRDKTAVFRLGAQRMQDIAEVRLRMRLRSRPVWTVEPRTGPPVRILASGWVLSAPQVTKLWNWLSTAGPGLEVQTSSGFGDNSARAVVLRRWEPDDISP